ncbi:MAG: ribonuclease domain-containing protein [Stappiaceae bacterium]
MAAQSAPSLPTYVAAGGLKLGVIGTKMAGLMALGLRYAPRGKRTDLHYTEVMDRIRTAEVGLKHARSRGNTKKINELNRDLYDERLNELNMIVPQKGYRRPASPHWVPSKKDFSELHDTIESAKKTWIAQSDQFLRKLEKRGTHILGQESGATFRNLENSLEKNDIHSKLGAKKGTKYYEYYVFHERPVPNLQYVNAGWTRLIIGSDERVYITFDHYNSFTEVRKMQPGFFESLRVNN